MAVSYDDQSTIDIYYCIVLRLCFIRGQIFIYLLKYISYYMTYTRRNWHGYLFQNICQTYNFAQLFIFIHHLDTAILNRGLHMKRMNIGSRIYVILCKVKLSDNCNGYHQLSSRNNSLLKFYFYEDIQDSKVHGTNVGPTCVLSTLYWPHEPCYQGCVSMFVLDRAMIVLWR